MVKSATSWIHSLYDSSPTCREIAAHVMDRQNSKGRMGSTEAGSTPGRTPAQPAEQGNGEQQQLDAVGIRSATSWIQSLCDSSPARRQCCSLAATLVKATHQFAELVVGLQAAQQAAELVIVGMVRQPALLPQQVSRAVDQPAEWTGKGRESGE